MRHVVLPRELTGVAANIVVLLGRDFPSGSHKVGPAYATLMEGELAGEIRPGENTIIGPSTGNFGIGTAYISHLMGYRCVVIMPDRMSAERYERIRRYGGELDLTPGSESDVILVLERTEHFKQDPKNKVLAQFELLPNYRFHRSVTGDAALEAARGVGQRAGGGLRLRPRVRRHPGRRRRDQGPLPRLRGRAPSSRRSAPRSSTTAAARTASRGSATRWSR